MSKPFILLVAIATLAGCGPSTGPSAAAPSPAASSGTAAVVNTPAPTGTATPAPTPGGLPGQQTYTKGTMTVDGAAITLPTVMYVTKQATDTATARIYGIGIPADAKTGDWYFTITYGVQGNARNVAVQAINKTGDRVQDFQTFSFTKLSDVAKGTVLYSPETATGDAKEHDGVVDVTFSGPLVGVPKATKQFVASFPGLPL